MWLTRAVLVATFAAGPLLAQSVYVGLRGGRVDARQYSNSGCGGVVVDSRVGFSSFCGAQSLTRSGMRPAAISSSFVTTLEFSQWIAIESELSFVEKGFREADGTDVRAEYFELPVTMRFGFPLTDFGVYFFAQAGVATSRQVNCEAARGVGNGTTMFAECEEWWSATTDYGGVTAVGGLLRRNGYQLTVSWRHTKGLRNLTMDPIDEQRRYNDTRALLVGFAVRAR